MLLLFVACSDRPSEPPRLPDEPVGIDANSGVTSAMGLPLPPSLPSLPPKTDVCADWADSVVVPAKFSVVECGQGRAALSGRADLLESCAEIQAGMAHAGWVETDAGAFRYTLTRGGKTVELACTETPAGVFVTVSAQ